MSVEYCGNIYYCEIRVTDYSGMKKRSPVIKKEKKKEWQKTGNQKLEGFCTREETKSF